MIDAMWFVLGGMAIIFAVLLLLLVTLMALNRWLNRGPEMRGKS